MRDKTTLLPMYRAGSWSSAGSEDKNHRKATVEQPHLFYRVGEVNDLFKSERATHVADTKALIDQHAFEKRRWEAERAFYLNELGRTNG